VKHLEVPLRNANPFIDLKDFVKISDFMCKHGEHDNLGLQELP
jgi:hypothetical protein